MCPLLLQNLAHLALTLAGLVVLFAMLHLQERAAGRFLAHHLGWRSVLITGWLGVTAHELGHLLLALLFGHRIVAWRLFRPDPATKTLGYVHHAYSRRSAWQVLGTFFIGTGPLWTGGALLTALLWWMLSPAHLLELWRQARALGHQPAGLPSELLELGLRLSASLWEDRSVLWPLQLYLGICVASHMAPSLADLAGALPGFVLGAVLCGVGAVLAAWLGRELVGIEGVLMPFLLLGLAAGIFLGLVTALAALVAWGRS